MQINKRKNNAPITDFWEQKLKINYDAEIEYYRKLCGLSYNIKLLQENPEYDAETDYLSYPKWERHILSGVAGLNANELETYTRFLNQKCRDNYIIITLYHSALLPYAIAFIGIFLNIILNLFPDINIYTSIILFIILFFSISGTIYIDLITAGKEEEVVKNFYHDVKEIVEKNKRV